LVLDEFSLTAKVTALILYALMGWWSQTGMTWTSSFVLHALRPYGKGPLNNEMQWYNTSDAKLKLQRTTALTDKLQQSRKVSIFLSSTK
jgi:hypothetical protein